MEFPIILIDDKKGIIHSIKNEKKFRITGEEIVSNRTLIGCKLIDVNGLVSEITNVIRTGWGNLFWGYNPLYNQRSVKVDFDLKTIQTLDIQEFKTVIIKCLEIQKENSEGKDSDTYLVANELIELTKKSNEFADIINRF